MLPTSSVDRLFPILATSTLLDARYAPRRSLRSLSTTHKQNPRQSRPSTDQCNPHPFQPGPPHRQLCESPEGRQIVCRAEGEEDGGD